MFSIYLPNTTSPHFPVPIILHWDTSVLFCVQYVQLLVISLCTLVCVCVCSHSLCVCACYQERA